MADMQRQALTDEQKQRARELLAESFYNLDIFSLVETYTATRLTPMRSGRQATGACPFDDCPGDHDGFIVFPTLSNQRKHFFCRTCHRSGTILDLVKEIRGVSFAQACELIGIENPYKQVRDEQGPGEPRPVDPRVAAARERRRQQDMRRREQEQEELNTLILLYPRMQALLLKHERPQLYLNERAIPLEVASTLGLAYIPPFDEIHITAKSEDERKKQVTFFQQWQDRIIFPLTSRAGAGFSGRALAAWSPGVDELAHKATLDELKIPRYKTTATAGYFHTDFLADVSHVTIVEGVFDACALYAAGITDVMATCTTSVDIEFIPINVCDATLAYDGDAPGQKAAREWQRAMQRKGIVTHLVAPDTDELGKDWSERYRRVGLDGLVKLLVSQQISQALLVTDEQYIETMFVADQGLIGEQVDDLRARITTALATMGDAKTSFLALPADEQRAYLSLVQAPAHCLECYNQGVETEASIEYESYMYCERHNPRRGQRSPDDSRDHPTVQAVAKLFNATIVLEPACTLADHMYRVEQEQHARDRAILARQRRYTSTTV